MTSKQSVPDDDVTHPRSALMPLARLLAPLVAEAMSAQPPSETWVPLDVAAQELGVRPRVLSDEARRGRITLGHAGRKRVVTRAELTRYAARRASEPTEATEYPMTRAGARAAARADIEALARKSA